MMSEAVKSGDIDKFMQEQMKYNIEVRDVVDIQSFNQSLIFSAAAIADEEQSIKMITILIQLGVDFHQKDNLKQTPLFYAARDGKVKLIQFLVE